MSVQLFGYPITKCPLVPIALFERVFIYPQTEGLCFHLSLSVTVLTSVSLALLSVRSTGAVPRQVHRHGLLAALLQAHAEQALGAEGPGVHRPRVLQLPHLDQVCPLGSSVYCKNDFEAAC